MRIDNPHSARQLAQAIARDVYLYNKEAVERAPVHERARVLAEPLADARKLFALRVAEPFLGMLDQALQEIVFNPLGVDGWTDEPG